MGLLLLGAGCPMEPSESDTSGTEADSDVELSTDRDTDTDTESNTEASPTDLDRDGVFTPEDCDDREPEVYPGALEVWDGLDNDCDGRIDGRGDYVGSHHLVATAIVEGQTRTTSVDCDVVLSRAAVVLSFEIVCPVPESDALARQLLGPELIIQPIENVATDGYWSGAAEVSSTAPWQATGSGTASWSADLSSIQLTTRLDSSSLTLRGTGSVDLP